jgi:hypothetical protein
VSLRSSRDRLYCELSTTELGVEQSASRDFTSHSLTLTHSQSVSDIDLLRCLTNLTALQTRTSHACYGLHSVCVH